MDRPNLVCLWLWCHPADHHNAALSFFRTGVLPQYSCYTLVRGGLEASARAWWLLDHHVTTEGRLRRGFAERIYNLGRILELEAQHRTDRAAKRLTGVQADARHRGVVPEPRPGITRLLSMLLPSREREDGEEAGRYVYRILSGYAHGEAWVMHTGSTPVPDTANGDAVGLMSTLNINVILSLMRAALRGHDVAMQALCALAGRPANAWEERRSPLYPDGHSMATDT
jgi:hypothetical protein